MGGQWAGRSVLSAEPLSDQVEGVSTQRAGVVPSFPEHGLGIADGRALHCQLDVMPRGTRAVYGSHLLSLGVATVMVVVIATVTQIDATYECDVAFRMKCVSQNYEFLVMGPERANPHIK